MIRKAKAVDTPRIAELIEEGYARSSYVTHGTLDIAKAKRIIVNAIQRDGLMNEGGWCVRVAEANGTVEGFVVGYLSRVYDIGDKLLARDWMLYGSPRCPTVDRIGLLDALDEWASANPKVLDLEVSVTDAVGDWKRVGQLYERRGLEQVGAVYRRRYER